MTTIPKPKHCEQNWLAMTPTDGGRICGQCSKVIFDFSKMAWADIERIQKENNISVCGMYTSKQLDNWGREIPNNTQTVLKTASITSLIISLSLTSYSQTSIPNDTIIIKGKVTDKTTNESLPSAHVMLRNCKLSTTTDLDGNFKFVVNNLPTAPFADTLEIKYVGYTQKLIVFKDLREINSSENKSSTTNGEIDASLTQLSTELNNAIYFYVQKPTVRQRIKWKFNQWFGRKDK